MNRLSFKPMILAGAVAVALGGCASVQNRTSAFGYTDYTALYSAGMVRYAAQSGEIATVVRGDPFGRGDTAMQAEAIASQLASPGWLGPRRFTTNPRADTKSNYKLVLVFNPTRLNVGDDQTCAMPGEEPTMGRSEGASKFMAVFCADARWASHLEGTVPLGQGPESVEFRNALNLAVLELMPPRNPKIETGDINIVPR